MNFLFQKSRARLTALPAIVALAAFLRLYRLDSLPPGMHFDVAFNYFDIFRLLRGEFLIFFPVNNGREPFYFYLSLIGLALFNDNVLAGRLTSALIGIATIPVIYWLARSLFNSNRVALLASFFLSISVWHIYYSRYGLRVILAVLLTALTVGYFWRAIILSPQGERAGVRGDASHTRGFFLAGLFLSLARYTYISSRFVPTTFVAITPCAMLLDRARARSYAAGLAITALVATAIFSPRAFYFWKPSRSVFRARIESFAPRPGREQGRCVWNLGAKYLDGRRNVTRARRSRMVSQYRQSPRVRYFFWRVVSCRHNAINSRRARAKIN